MKIAVLATVIAILIIGLVLVLMSRFGLINTNRQEIPSGPAPSLGAPLDESLNDVSLDEYSLEFEGIEEGTTIDQSLCNDIKAACDQQKINDCVDYELCVQSMKSQ